MGAEVRTGVPIIVSCQRGALADRNASPVPAFSPFGTSQ
jgi:hypothetical protein